MAKRVCTEAGCPELVDAGTYRGRCTQHQRAWDKARGTKTQRGYGAAFNAERKRWAPLVATGHINCWRCGQPITGPFDLGHDDNNRHIIRGPEHPRCNRQAAGRSAHQ